jgi:hypothetical protein
MGTTEIISLIAIASSILVTVVTALARTAEADKERRIAALEKQDAQCLQKQEAHAERLRVDELATERLGGRMALAEQKAAQHSDQLARTVSQVEFERALDGIQKGIDGIASRLDRFDRTGRSGGYPATDPTKSNR